MVDLFDKKLRKDAERKLKMVVEDQKRTADGLTDDLGKLYETRQDLKKKLDDVFEYINSMKNTPENIDIQVKQINIGMEKYQNLIDVAQADYKKAKLESGGALAGGLTAAAGISFLGPTAVIGAVTTFGTASTGTAISSLSGIAWSNAVNAAIGGGSLATGGAGIAGGQAILALAGPIGWAISGSTLIGSGLMYRGKNKKAAEKMMEQKSQIRAVKLAQRAMDFEVRKMKETSEKDSEDLSFRLKYVSDYSRDFNLLEDNQVSMLGTLVNNAHTSVNHLNMKLNKDGKFETA